jgi:hypothetical protein
MHGKVSTPNTHSRSRCLEPFVDLIPDIIVMEYAKRLLFIDICRAYTFIKKELKRRNADMVLEQTSSQSDLHSVFRSDRFKMWVTADVQTLIYIITT